MDIDSLSDSLVKTISNDSLRVVADLSEIGLDVLLEDNIVKQIPMLSTMVGVYKIGHTISELHQIKQMLSFIYEMNIDLIDDKTRNDYIKKFKKKSIEQRNKELERIILITNHYIDESKPRLLSKIYISYINGKIDWERFVSYSEIIDRLLPGDLEELRIGKQLDVNDNDVNDSLLRLHSLGLIKAVSKEIDTPTTVGTIHIPGNSIKDYELTPFGEKLRECLALK